jgi:hypothetical protein
MMAASKTARLLTRFPRAFLARPILAVPSRTYNCSADHLTGDNRTFRKRLRPKVGTRLAERQLPDLGLFPASSPRACISTWKRQLERRQNGLLQRAFRAMAVLANWVNRATVRNPEGSWPCRCSGRQTGIFRFIVFGGAIRAVGHAPMIAARYPALAFPGCNHKGMVDWGEDT